MEFIDITLLKDGLLLALCAAACGYCALLSHRLKRLRDMKTGLGASILELTQAIEQTHACAQSSRNDIQNSLAELAALIETADRASTKAEARIAELGQAQIRADEVSKRLSVQIDEKAPAAIRKSLRTTEALLKLVRGMQASHRKQAA